MAGFFKSLYNKLANKAEIDWDDLEAELVAADLGPKLAMQIILELRDLGRQVTAEDVIDVARRQISDRLPPDSPPLLPRMDGKPFVFLVVGIKVKSGRRDAATLKPDSIQLEAGGKTYAIDNDGTTMNFTIQNDQG